MGRAPTAVLVRTTGRGLGAVPWRPEMFDRRRDAVAVHEEMSGVTETMPPATGADGFTDDLDDGLPEIRRSLSALDALDELAVSEHVTVFESIHQSFQAVLDEPEHG